MLVFFMSVNCAWVEQVALIDDPIRLALFSKALFLAFSRLVNFDVWYWENESTLLL